MTRWTILLIVANVLVVAALVVLTALVDQPGDSVLYGDIFALVALGLSNFLLWSTRRRVA